MSSQLVSYTAPSRTTHSQHISAPNGRKKLSTRALVLTIAAATIACGFIVTIGLLTWQSGQLQKKLARDYLVQTTENQASRMQNSLDAGYAAARELASGVISLKQAHHADRQVAETLLKNTLKHHPELLSVSLGWEPDAFDGRDGEFAGQPGQDPNGRFVRYVDRDNAGNIALHLLSDYETPGSGNYYILPRERQKEVVLDPYIYPYNGVDVMLTSLAVPIMIDGRFHGVVTADVALTSLQKETDSIKPYPGAYAQLFSHTGVYIAHPDKSRIGKQAQNSQALLDGVKSGATNVLERFSDSQGADVFNINVPIAVGDTGTPWVLGLAVPIAEVLAESIRQRHIAIVLTLLSVIVVSCVVGVVFTRKVLRPVGGEPADAAKIALAVAQGDLTQVIPLRPKDESSIFYAMYAMQKQLREIATQLARTCESVNHGAAEIAAGNIDLAARTEQQASALEETAASMEQITATVKQNADNANQATRLTHNTAQIAQRGHEVVHQAIDIMGQIE